MLKTHWNALASFIDRDDIGTGREVEGWTLAACSQPDAGADVTDIPVLVTCKRCHAVMAADARRMLSTLDRMARGLVLTPRGWKPAPRVLTA